MANVYIVYTDWSTERMWTRNGHNVVADLGLADIVQFTGGSDVSPELYGEANVRSYCDARRDDLEQKIFDRCYKRGVPMVGLCRGGQFLNVMNGGKMWQHVDNHAIASTHGVYDEETGRIIQCTSTHHQMMRPASNGESVAVASPKRTRICWGDGHIGGQHTGADIEVVWYQETLSLCFQPHPEFEVQGCEDYYFELIERYLGEYV